MGGMEGSRGYVYQGIVSVIKALTEPDWDRIQIELPTDGDKVDIALSQGSRVVKAIQVKSTINSFSLLNLKTWTQELIADYPCACYEIVLLGQCEKDANDFIKALDKYYLNALDKQAKRILQMLFIEEMKPAEIARILNCTEQYVYDQKYQAIKKFRAAKKKEATNNDT